MRTGIRRSAIAVLAGACALVLAACSADTSTKPTLPTQVEGALSGDITGQIDDAVKNAMTLANAPGAIVGVWAPWSGFSLKGYGKTAFKDGTDMTPDMHYRTGGSTRAMSCSVLLSLADKGTVKLDEPVTKYLPGLVGIKGITLEQLCQGTSGIADFRPNLDYIFITNPERVWSPIELLSDGLANAPTGEPGQVFSASDSGYVLLGIALEEAADLTMDELYETYVSAPIGLSNTSLPAAGVVELPSPHPSAFESVKKPDGTYACDAPVDESKQSSSMGYSAAGAVSTADEMHKFMQAYTAGGYVDDAHKKALEKTVPLSAKAPAWQSYGFGLYHFGPMQGQLGDVPGFISATLTDPKSGLTVVVMLNNSTAGAGVALNLALELASYGSKAPAASGEKAPSIELPWSPEQMRTEIKTRAVCQTAK